ncbi:MAG: thrombospondin type 3 repeat-containing protein [bacterium]
MEEQNEINVNDNESILEEHRPHNLNKNQKIAVTVLVFFAVFIFAASLTSLGDLIRKPAQNINGTGNNNIKALEQEDSEASLRAKDTDNDGLSDWEEANVYLTSPYIVDSDSDGLSDGEEVISGSNPNCFEGRDCLGANTAIVSDQSTVNQQNIISETQADLSGVITSQEDVENILKGNVDVATLREILLKAGMQAELLNRFSDEELMSMYKQTAESVDYQPTAGN